MNHSKRTFLYLCILFTILFILFAPTSTFAADPKIVSKLQSGFEDIEGWILKLATPAAAVAVGTGIFMRKFSFRRRRKNSSRKKISKKFSIFIWISSCY